MLFRWRIHHAEGRFHAINDILNETHFEKLEKRDNKTKKNNNNLTSVLFSDCIRTTLTGQTAKIRCNKLA